ncbi:hypothetical protein DSL72_001346 [Monilinia vaccinii-corymbosi]|uniref:FHA domain-containing protein n=1 Tax=Monilinia vaccinii-corymbosi TaxID=61207 RepID=A0A8A3PAK6_9HELO|nr:hypothetical protein DSL72_001346 [Monilinia vaccinii-corymbosi]
MSVPSRNSQNHNMYHHQVKVHLRRIPVTKNDLALEPATRILNLTPTKPVMKIGRASKSPAKGIQSATDNAWFDSPVMSRDHAEIIYNPSEKKIKIRDLGSMHGTFVNGEKLGDDIKPLNLNDKIVFGTGVRRGMEMFPACHFDVAYELIPWKKPNSYTVPDSSSDEDEDCSEEDRSERASSPHDTSIEMMEACRSSPTASKSIDAIDLTLYDTPSPSVEAIEPSSISTTKKTTEQEHTPKSPVLGHGSPEVSVVSYPVRTDDGSTISESHTTNKENNRPPSFVYDDKSDDGEEDIPSSPHDPDVSGLSPLLSEDFDVGNDSDVSELSASCSADFDVDNDSEDFEASGASTGSEGNILVTRNREIYSPAFSSPEVSRAPSPVPAVTTCRPPFDNADIPESHVRTQIGTTKALVLCGNGSDEEEDDASVGLSEAANEGLQTLIKDDLLENNLTNPSVSKNNPTNSNTWYTNMYPRSTRYGPPACSSSYWPSDREASPSAVAMVKAPGPSNMAENSIDQSFDVNASWKSCFKSLGDKTGKHAFFEAREDNKMKFQAHIGENEGTKNDCRPESPRPSFTRPTQDVRFAHPLSHILQPMQPVRYHGGNFDHGFEEAAHRSIAAEIIDQTISSPPYLIGSAEERPSIHPYYFSSDASSKAPESPVFERYPARSGLRIDDIIDGSSTVKASKRKADEISKDDNLREPCNSLTEDVRKNEVRNWASLMEKLATSPGTISDAAHQSSAINVAPSVSATSNVEVRPIKRLKMKKFAEAVGYFALGGAAVGAGLFSALVATAPDFL